TPNPATGEVLARGAPGGAGGNEPPPPAAPPRPPGRAPGSQGDTERREARRAFDDGAWVKMRPTEREAILLRIAELIEAHGDELAQLETLDNGKPFTESRYVDIPSAAATFRYYAGWVTKLYGETNPSDPAYFNFTLREPVGVCGQIIPWKDRKSTRL